MEKIAITVATLQKVVTFLESLPYSQVFQHINDIVSEFNAAKAELEAAKAAAAAEVKPNDASAQS